MTSMQLHPLFAFAGIGASNLPSTSSSSSSQSGNSTSTSTISNSALASLISIPNGPILPSGLSITVAPPQSNNSSTSSKGHEVKSPKVEPHDPKMEIDNDGSPPSSPQSTSSDLSPKHSNGQALAAQQQALRALANGLQSMNTSSGPASAAALNQASLLAAATKLMELNATPVDDILMQEVTQRLVKMNQEIWHASTNNSGAGGQGQGQGPSAVTTSTAASHAHAANAITTLARTVEAMSHATGGSGVTQQQVNEMKLAEKLVNDLAVQQQSSRNAFHLNERTLQECWNTLQRVSCMIFMHKSAMQLQQQQQQQQQAVVAQQVQNHHGISPTSHSGLIRAGSVVSSAGSEAGGISKPHQCQQCLKAFSSNHQLVQHVRVHTGEKPYKCSYCDRRFKQLSHVQQHTRLHTGERPYKCHVQECGRAFIQLSNLQQHLRNHDAQLERSKNRPFHCNICGKGFATESSLRTHTAKVCKEHAALIGGPNAVTCPICHKLFLGGEALMEHMKHTHKDPNASGVATKRRTANHPCPICGKHYVNEGSLRKHLTCHPETAQLSTSLRMWPCSVCQAVFSLESGLLAHMEQMRMDPKHSFAAQYVLSQAAAERRERENMLTAAVVASMNQGQSHPFGGGSQGQSLSGLLQMPASPSGSESSGRLSSPLDTAPGLPHVQHHSRHGLTSPLPLDARIGNSSGNQNSSAGGNSSNTAANPSNGNNNNSSGGGGDSAGGNSGTGQMNLGRKEYSTGSMEKYESKYDYEKLGHLNENNNITSLLSGMRGLDHHGPGHGPSSHHPNHDGGPGGKSYHVAMKMAAMLGQGHLAAHGHSNMMHHQGGPGHGHGQDMMSTHRLQAEALLRSQAEALRLAVANSNGLNNPNIGGNNGSSLSGGGTNSSSNGPNLSETLGNLGSLNLVAQQQHQHQQHHQHLQQQISNGHVPHGMHHPQSSLNQQQLNSILSQNSDLSEALLRLDARTLGFPLPAHNS